MSDSPFNTTSGPTTDVGTFNAPGPLRVSEEMIPKARLDELLAHIEALARVWNRRRRMTPDQAVASLRHLILEYGRPEN